MLAGAGLAFGVTGNAGSSREIGILVGVAGLHTQRSAFVISSSAVDAVGTGIHTPIAFSVAGLAETVLTKVVKRAALHASSVKGETANAAGTVLGDYVTSGAGGIAVSALVDGGLVESLSAVEGTDASNHHIGALVIADTAVKDLS